MTIYKCDRCGKEFGGPLDREVINGETVDLCFPCRKELKDLQEQGKINFMKGDKS